MSFSGGGASPDRRVQLRGQRPARRRSTRFPHIEEENASGPYHAPLRAVSRVQDPGQAASRTHLRGVHSRPRIPMGDQPHRLCGNSDWSSTG